MKHYNIANIVFDNRIMENIKISGLDQFIHENLMWERALNFYKMENAFLKTRLSQVVDNNTDKDFVNLAEHFHNRFLFTDEYIKELSLDVRLQTDLIKKLAAGETLQEKAMSRQQKLRTLMETFEKDILGLKNDFNKKLVSYIFTTS